MTFLVMVAALCLSFIFGGERVIEVDGAFEAELEQLGVRFVRQAEGTYEIEAHGQSLTVSLDNLRRNYAREHDRRIVTSFVAAILKPPPSEPDWPAARRQARLALEPADYDFGKAVRISSTANSVLVAVLVTPDESHISWVLESDLTRWGITRDEFLASAHENMSSLLDDTPLVVEMAAGRRLGMLETDSPLKASFIASPNLRRHVETKLGWPVLAVAPARDFLYLFAESEGDSEFLGRLGGVVIREYSESAYPISTEVFRISDDGIKAIGAFPVPE
jgi:hypothetical protein